MTRSRSDGYVHPPARFVPVALETEYEDTIVEAALTLGYLVHAERPARTAAGHRTAIKGVAGWPDLVIVGYGRLLIVELKRKGNKPTPEQTRWIDELTRAGIPAFVAYVPEQLTSILEWLEEGRR